MSFAKPSEGSSSPAHADGDQPAAVATAGQGVELALGTVQFGLAYGVVGSGRQVDDGEAVRILRRSAELGVRVLDTAAAYGDIEQRLAGLAAQSGRTRFVVVTKIPPLPANADAAMAASFVREAIQRSATRLGPSLATVLFHRAEDLLGPLAQPAWSAAAEVAADLGLRLGVSCYGPAELKAIAGRFPVAVAQLPGNALDQRLAGCAFPGIELHLRSAFLQGLLLAEAGQGAQRVPAAAAALRLWHRRCDELGLPPLTAALGAVKALPGLRCCVVGVESVAQLEEIAGAWAAAAPMAVPELASTDPAVIDPRVWVKA